MKIFYYIGIILIASLHVTCVSFGQQRVFEQVKFERKPFQKNPYVIKQPEHVDRTAEYGEKYRPKSRVVEVDKKAGKYEFRWTGFDGQEKTIAYQRPDAIDAAVAAKVTKNMDGKFIYTYDLSVLPTSPIYFRDFIVQTFGANSEVLKLDREFFMFLQMGSVNLFKEGVWWSWGYRGDKRGRIHPGDSIEFNLSSENPPGIAKCKVGGGEFGQEVDGVEGVPSEVEAEIPINSDLANGYTIGPDERLSKFTKPKKIKYLLENLPKFQEAGWMSEGTAKNYGRIFNKGDLKSVFEKAKKDFKNGFISSEVFHIIEGLSQ